MEVNQSNVKSASGLKRYQAAKSSIKLCQEIYKKVKNLNKYRKGKKQEKRKRPLAKAKGIKLPKAVSSHVGKSQETWKS